MADSMERLNITHILDEWPSGLINADEVADKLGVSATRITDLANSGFVPHYKIDGGEIRFKLVEVKRWAVKNIMQYNAGKDLPEPVIVVAHKPRANPQDVPYAIQAVPNLRDLGDFMVGSGIYFLCYKQEVVYVGQSVNITARITAHAGKTFDRVFFLPWPKDDLDRVEGAFIRTLRAPLNMTVRGAPAAPASRQDDAEVIRTLKMFSEEKITEMFND